VDRLKKLRSDSEATLTFFLYGYRGGRVARGNAETACNALIYSFGHKKIQERLYGPFLGPPWLKFGGITAWPGMGKIPFLISSNTVLYKMLAVLLAISRKKEEYGGTTGNTDEQNA
jgi:hypothetical protein